jgi:ABC-type lipoprotein release transport system permease subunit
MEGCFLGIVGAALGIGLGFGVSLLINQAGGLPFNVDGQRIAIRLLLSGQTVWLNLVPAAVVGALASFLPGLRAVKLTPSECLRQV